MAIEPIWMQGTAAGLPVMWPRTGAAPAGLTDQVRLPTVGVPGPRDIKLPWQLGTARICYRADQGITPGGGGGAQAWADLAGAAAHDLLSTTPPATDPAILAAVLAINARACLGFDGLVARLNRDFGPGSLPQPCEFYFVVRMDSLGVSTLHDIFMDGGSIGSTIIAQNNTPEGRLFAGNSLVGATVAFPLFALVRAVYAGAASSLEEIGSPPAVVGDAGPNAADGLTLSGLANGTRFTAFTLAECAGYYGATPPLSVRDRQWLLRYFQYEYGTPNP